MASSPPRPRVEDLLAYDLAVSAWIDGLEDGEAVCDVPFEAPPSSVFDDVADGGARPLRPYLLAGFDEAGRGALAGPVTVACVAFDARRLAAPLLLKELIDDLVGLDDSKRLTPPNREALFERIVRRAAWGVGCASAREIDRVGIVAACCRAARRAHRNLGISVDRLLFDRGLTLRDATGGAPSGGATRETTATGADGRSLHVAAASIVAKVTRDRYMTRLGGIFPGYELGRHKGYGTAVHRDAIRSLGPTRIHRRTFTIRPETAKSQSC